jgi:SAM-dependent methyltransferase
VIRLVFVTSWPPEELVRRRAYGGDVAASLDPVLDVVRCPDCAERLHPADAGAVACAAGHRFDLISARAPDLARTVVQQDTPGQRAMRFRPLVAVYESLWRPLFTRLAGGTNPAAETDQLLGWLAPADGATILDLACGPGNTTRRLASGAPGASVIGLDLSVPMLEEAVEKTGDGSPVGFARVDAHSLPVADATIDAVHCAAALYLFGDPAAVIGEVARVLRPGGGFAGMTLVAPLQPLGAVGRQAEQVFARLSGLRYFDGSELEAMCTAAGLVGFRSAWRGGALLFVAERPAAT